MKHALSVLVVCGLLYGGNLLSQEKGPKEDAPAKEATAAEQKGAKRLAVFRKAVQELQVESETITDKARLTFPDKPILRYNDITRNFFDASVWRLGTKGRPTALLTLEMYGNRGKSALLMHEFTSLADTKFTVDTPLGVHWHPHDTDCKFKPVPDAPEPAATPALRLAQMREISRRFACVSTYNKQVLPLRLLTQPLDRYEDPEAGIQDGAIFAFATGTNPELILLLEAGPKGWTYGLSRSALAQLDVTIDDKPVFSFPQFYGEGRENDYFSEPYNVEVDWN